MKMKIDCKPLAKPLAASIALLLSGCMVGPDYHRPQVSVPATYRELPGWTQAEPAADGPKGQWWTAFNDPLLNELEPQVEVSNQTVRQDYANYQEALAEVKVARSALFTTIGVRYTPTLYTGDLYLFRADGRGPEDDLSESLGWDKSVTGAIEVIRVPGTHDSLLNKPSVCILAEKLQSRLTAAASR